MKIVTIIQARMGSKRLPGKVMLPILGKPILWHIVNRLRFCKEIDEICIATSTNPEDHIIEEFAIKEQILLHRGPEDDVLERILGAVEKFQADVIVRITADCPLVDPNLVDTITRIFKNNPKLEYVSNIINRTFPDGLDTELYSTKLLQKLSKENERNRMNFVRYIIQNHKKYKTENYSSHHNLPNLRWTLDYPEDYHFIKKIYQELFTEEKVFGFESILDLLNKRPKLSQINSMYPTDM